MSKALKAGAPYYLLLKATYYSKLLTTQSYLLLKAGADHPFATARPLLLCCTLPDGGHDLSCYAALYLTEGSVRGSATDGTAAVVTAATGSASATTVAAFTGACR